MTNIEELLAQCLKEIEEGDSVEECLARHPERREELAPLLRAAQRMRAAPKVSPSHAFRQSARTRMLNMLEAKKSAAEPHHDEAPGRTGIFQRLGLAVPTMVTVVLILLLVTTGLGVVHASSRSLPGDPLYEVKLAVEQIRLTLSLTQAGDIEARLASAERRLEEAVHLAEANGEREMEAVMTRYTNEIEAASEALEDQRLSEDQATSLARRLQNRLEYHQGVLKRVQAQVPKEAQSAIERAMNASNRAQERASGVTDKPKGPPRQVPAKPEDRPQDAAEPPRATPTASPSPRSDGGDGGTPAGHTRTPQSAEQSMTPQSPGWTRTPQPPGRTQTPHRSGPAKRGKPPGELEPTEGSVPTKAPDPTEHPAPTEEMESPDTADTPGPTQDSERPEPGPMERLEPTDVSTPEPFQGDDEAPGSPTGPGEPTDNEKSP